MTLKAILLLYSQISPVSFWSEQRPKYLFSGLMRCGDCGGGFSKISLHHFGCSTARNQGSTACTNLLTMRRDVLEEMVLGALRERLMGPVQFRDFAAAFTAEWNRLQAETSAGLLGKRQELESRMVIDTDDISFAHLVYALAWVKWPSAVFARAGISPPPQASPFASGGAPQPYCLGSNGGAGMRCNGTGFMTADSIAAAAPYSVPPPGADPLELARARMEATGQWHPRQSMGRRWSIGCVALEITQRCNLDCTLCYLSDHSEAVQDIPLEAIFSRIDLIRTHYGPDTDVQVTGGDPTLRQRDELIAIIRRVRDRGMRPSLFTNGIKATREMLTELCEAGLVDVAFHVDMTQERKGYRSEAELNAVRLEYIERARGLPLSVFFNTTVFDGNFHEIAGIAEFFVQHADVVRLASFQLQADTGRGTLRGRLQPIDIGTVAGQLRIGAGAPINFDTPIAGHGECNRYAMTLEHFPISLRHNRRRRSSWRTRLA